MRAAAARRRRDPLAIGTGNVPEKRVGNYVLGTPSATVYHDPRWGALIRESFGHSYRLLWSTRRSGEINGLLPLVHMKSLLFGSFLVSLPYFNYGGVCADDAETEAALVEEAVRIARDLRVDFVELRQDKRLGNDLPRRTEKVSMRLRLDGGPEALWRAFSPKLRSQIRRPQKENMQVRIGKTEELDGFYRVFSINMRDLGTPVYPKHFFRRILDRFPENTWICTVYDGTRPVASGFLIGFKDRLEIPWASSIRTYNSRSPNMLMYWRCLSFGCERSYAEFDFGRSTPGSGTYRFKEQWGAVPHQLHWHYWVRNGGKIPNLSVTNSRFKLAIRFWKTIPVGIARLVGPVIVKNIP